MTLPHGFPVDQHARGVLYFRWTVFLLAAGYTVYQVVLAADYTSPGGPFRFLTIWALLLSFFVASRNLAYSEHRSDRVWRRTVMVTAVVNAMVVALYWRLYFIDPALVTNGPPVWHQEYYLHLVGPLLQWIDALFILGAFRRWWRAIPPLLGLVAAYVLWVELVVGPLNDAPRGSVTSGLPYPFLNSMTAAERLEYYAVTGAQAVAVLAVFAALAWAVRRVRRVAGSQATP